MTKVILGIDPGTAITGFGVIQDIRGQVTYIDCGCIVTSKGISPSERLLTIEKSLDILIKKYQPDILAIEKLFFTKNITTAISVAEARGVILLTAVKNNIETTEYTPLQVKQTLTGYGKADKQQMQRMIKTILKLQNIPEPDDAADALAIAICAVHYKTNKVI